MPYVEQQYLVASFSHKIAIVSDYFLEQEHFPDDDNIPEKAREHCILGLPELWDTQG
jgi:hypothetical protein